MKVRLVAVGKRMAGWVDAGFDDYQRRLPNACRLELHEIAAGDRRGGDSARAVADEDRRMLGACLRDSEVIALEAGGSAWSSQTLAERLRGWLADGRDRTLLIGGPDGIGEQSQQRAAAHWSLSPLTLPHGLVRVVVAEQIYRAHSILGGHPYHRG